MRRTFREHGLLRRAAGKLAAMVGVSEPTRRHRAIDERDRFFEISLELFFMADLEGRFLQVNPAFSRMTGYAITELLAKDYRSLVYEDDREAVAKAMANLGQGEAVPRLLVRIVDRNGAIRSLELNAVADAEQVVYCAGRDITRQRELEEKLSSRDAMLRIAGRTARIGGWWLDASPDALPQWSDEVCAIHDVPPGTEVTKERALSFYTGGSLDTVRQRITACLADGTPFDEELEIITAKRRHCWVRAIGEAVRDDRGRIYRVQGSTQDITSQKNASLEIRRLADRLYTTLESITEAFFMVNQDWQFTYLNQEAERVLQRSRTDLIGRSLWDEFPEIRGSIFEQEYRRAMETGSSVEFEDYYEPLKLWAELLAYPSSEGLAVYFRNINDRKETEQRITAMLLELERSNRDLEDFAFVASHDLQEPLRKIQAFSERLETVSQNLDEQQTDYLRRMREAAERLQQLISDMLSYSRISTGARENERIDTGALLNRVLTSLETRVQQTGACIEVGQLPDIYGDRVQIHQVFQNLISNALKFQAENAVPRIHIYCEDSDDVTWTCCVEDNGLGISSRYLEKIFQPFQRLHSRTQYPGTGIGLALVKKVMGRHGTGVAVSSEPGVGTVFRLQFRKGEPE